jgi:hypothetical protein
MRNVVYWKDDDGRTRVGVQISEYWDENMDRYIICKCLINKRVWDSSTGRNLVHLDGLFIYDIDIREVVHVASSLVLADENYKKHSFCILLASDVRKGYFPFQKGLFDMVVVELAVDGEQTRELSMMEGKSLFGNKFLCTDNIEETEKVTKNAKFYLERMDFCMKLQEALQKGVVCSTW